MRICSFLPSATEIVYLLGLEDQLFGVTHECDFPVEARSKTKLTSSGLSNSNATSNEIDSAVRNSLHTGEGIYTLNLVALKEANPDLILTQELCEVCAVSYGEIYRAASSLARRPDIVSLDTFNLQDILASILTVGAKCGVTMKANETIASMNERIDRVTELAGHGEKRRVFFMEWIDPIMSCGHWMPELIMRAGGDDIFGTHGKNSKRVDWKDLVAYKPDWIIISPCGFGVERGKKEAAQLKKLEGWQELPAVQNGNVFVADGNAYFSRPGPRIIDGLEILSLILAPNLEGQYDRRYSEKDYVKLDCA